MSVVHLFMMVGLIGWPGAAAANQTAVDKPPQIIQVKLAESKQALVLFRQQDSAVFAHGHGTVLLPFERRVTYLPVRHLLSRDLPKELKAVLPDEESLVSVEMEKLPNDPAQKGYFSLELNITNAASLDSTDPKDLLQALFPLDVNLRHLVPNPDEQAVQEDSLIEVVTPTHGVLCSYLFASWQPPRRGALFVSSGNFDLADDVSFSRFLSRQSAGLLTPSSAALFGAPLMQQDEPGQFLPVAGGSLEPRLVQSFNALQPAAEAKFQSYRINEDGGAIVLVGDAFEVEIRLP